MAMKIGIFFVAILVGSLAIPPPSPQEAFPDPALFFHTDPAARIVGGTPAALASATHMVGLTVGATIRSFVCGGSLITTRTVLTAAHCIAAAFSLGQLNTSLRGTVGTNQWNVGGQQYAFARNVTHEHYVSATIKNDIGILITTTDVALSDLVTLIPLGTDYVPGGVLSRATGWGRIRQGDVLAPTLLELLVATIDGERCIHEVRDAALALNMNAPGIEPHVELCTFHSAGHGMCNGDSGSALVRLDRQEQIGIVSWGLPCARGAPDMFVRVSAYTDWLERHTVA